MKFVDNKSICEIYIKLLNEIMVQGLPIGVSAVLQQSGQSGENSKINSGQKKIQEVILKILEENSDEQ